VTDGLQHFTPQERVRLVRLRALVRATRQPRRTDAPDSRQHRAARAVDRWWLPAVGVALIGLGTLGVVRTSIAMDDLPRTSLVTVAPVSLGERVLPGLIAHPGVYLSAINGGGSSPLVGSAGDGLYRARLIDLKAAMDRSEAALASGAGLLLLAVGTNAHPDTSLAADVAPFLLIAAFLCAALSFFELP